MLNQFDEMSVGYWIVMFTLCLNSVLRCEIMFYLCQENNQTISLSVMNMNPCKSMFHLWQEHEFQNLAQWTNDVPQHDTVEYVTMYLGDECERVLSAAFFNST